MNDKAAGPSGDAPDAVDDDLQPGSASGAAQESAASQEEATATDSGRTNVTDTPGHTDETADLDTNDGAAPAPVAVAGKPGGRGLAWLALLLSLLAAAGSGFLGWQWWIQRDAGRELALMGESNHEQINRFKSSVTDLEKQFASERSARNREIEALRNQLGQANTQIEGQARRLLSLTATTTDDWRLAEVEYLLRLANQRILTSKDGRTALNLLQSADEILVELGDPRLFAVRKAIAEDRAALALVGGVDLDGVFLRLAALGSQVEKLPLLSVPAFADREAQAPSGQAVDTESQPASALGKLREIAASTWSELKSLVVIQQRDASVKPLLPPQQQYYLRNNLRLLINQAQLALLDGRQAPYTESLRNARQLLQDYFPMEEAANKAAAAELEELAQVTVAAEYPDVSASLVAIKGFIAEQHRLGSGKQPGTGAASKEPAQ